MKKILYWLVTGIPRIYSALSCSGNVYSLWNLCNGSLFYIHKSQTWYQESVLIDWMGGCWLTLALNHFMVWVAFPFKNDSQAVLNFKLRTVPCSLRLSDNHFFHVLREKVLLQLKTSWSHIAHSVVSFCCGNFCRCDNLLCSVWICDSVL